MNALISIDPTFGNCVGLYKALSLAGPTEAYFEHIDRKGMYQYIPHEIGYNKVPKDCDRYYVVGAGSFERFVKYRSFVLRKGKKLIVILSDSYFKLYAKRVSRMLRNHTVYCMADLAHRCSVPHKIYYHPYEAGVVVQKNPRLTISHSPFGSNKMIQKGTHTIMLALMKIQHEHKFDFDLILDKSREEAIELKSRSHIFIDQCIPEDDRGWAGGLGKSGIEAMAAGVLTLTSGVTSQNYSEIPPPPVISITPESVGETVRYYITHPKEREQSANDQKRWVETYLNYEYQSKYLTP